MPDLPLSVLVTRTSLSLPDLALHVPGVYKLVSLDPGQASQRRTTADSPFVQGETLVSSVKQQTRLSLMVRVYGVTPALLESRTAALLAAFDQFSYEVEATVDGVVHRWACDAADYGPVDGIDKYGLLAGQQVYAFDVPRHPVPVIGAV